MNNTNIKIAKRLTALRVESKLTQKELAERLSEISKRETPVTPPLISSWETGRRSPSLTFCKYLAAIYNVSIEYIQCKTDEPQNTFVTPEPISIDIEKHYKERQEIAIPLSEIGNYDKKPVFVSFKNLAHPDQWGIVNTEKKCIVLAGGVLSISSPVIKNIYIDEPTYYYFASINGRYPLDNAKLHKTKREMWVELITSDKELQGLYNGWYKHNETHTCLINKIGLTLPYEGLGISYRAYLDYSSQSN